MEHQFTRPYDVKRTSAPPKIINGVEFTCWKTGIGRCDWLSSDKRITARWNFEATTYSVWVDGACKGRLFRSLDSAMRAGVKATKP